MNVNQIPFFQDFSFPYIPHQYITGSNNSSVLNTPNESELAPLFGLSNQDSKCYFDLPINTNIHPSTMTNNMSYSSYSSPLEYPTNSSYQMDQQFDYFNVSFDSYFASNFATPTYQELVANMEPINTQIHNSFQAQIPLTCEKFQLNVSCLPKPKSKSLPIMKSELNENETNLVCNTCYAKFSRKNCLKRHLLIHIGEKPHKCEPCNRAFYRYDLFNRHLKTSKCIKNHKR